MASKDNVRTVRIKHVYLMKGRLKLRYISPISLILMQSTTIVFPHYNARSVFTAVKQLFEGRLGLNAVRCDEDRWTIEARKGAWISPLSEKIHCKVEATGTTSCKVVVESSSRSILNLIFGFGSNKRNVSDLSDAIQNAVFRLMTDGEIKMNNNPIKLKPQDIKFRSNR